MTSLTTFWLGCFTLLGAMVGSFLNVVVYRLPLGKSIVTPPSACPTCDQKLAWYDNVPVLGWLWLRGRCRTCQTKISIQYPIVEAVTAILFGGWFYLSYMMGEASVQPYLSQVGFEASWSIFLVQLFLIGAMIVASMIDARFYIIPLPVMWLAAAVAVIVLPIAGTMLPLEAWMSHGHKGEYTLNWERAIGLEDVNLLLPVVGVRSFHAAIAGAIGWVIAMLLLRLGWLPLSFPELPVHKGQDQQKASDDSSEGDQIEESPWVENPSGVRQLLFLLAPVGMIVVGWFLLRTPNDFLASVAVRFDRGEDVLIELLFFGVLGYGLLGIGYGVRWGLRTIAWHDGPDRKQSSNAKKKEGQKNSDDPAGSASVEDWMAYPHPRREILKELLFIAIPLVAAISAAIWWPMPSEEMAATWFEANRYWSLLGGVIMGMGAGALVVWLVRIFGTLGFGKEAMGLGDAHLMMAIGAVCGAPEVILAFFIAPFFGILHAVWMALLGRLTSSASDSRGMGGPIPYGPHLVAATIVVMVWRQSLMAWLGQIGQ